jgi:DNA-binding NtrC family response regulator
VLAGHFLEKVSRASGQERTINDDAMKALIAYDWPGNVRELENCLERACAFTTGPLIQTGDLPTSIHSVRSNTKWWWRSRKQDSADRRAGKANDPEYRYAPQRRQAPGCASSGNWKNHPVPKIERIRAPRVTRSTAIFPSRENAQETASLRWHGSTGTHEFRNQLRRA